MRQLITELKRRRVFRVAAAYAVVAWMVIQAADILVPGLELPSWILTTVIVLALLGFPVALVLAWAFQVSPDGIRRTQAATPATAPSAAGPAGAGAAASGFGRLARRPGLWFVTGFLVALTGAWVLLDTGAPAADAALDEDVVAVLPFRTSGADASLAYLREGMVDLFAATLTGDPGPRALDSRTLLAAWRGATARGTEADAGDAATDLSQADGLALARQLGAGRLLLGEAVGNASRLVLNASLVDVATGGEAVRARVEGPVDSLPTLVDRLTARLVSLGAGENLDRVAALADVPLPAVRAYLAGQAAYRSGRYGDAVDEFRDALAADSTFALAALGLASTAGWSANGLMDGALKVAYASAARLPAADRAYLEALAGPAFPRPSSALAQLSAAQRAVAVAPDRPEAIYLLGDKFFHYGRVLGIQDAHERAAQEFRRALALDSTFTPPLQHLIDIAAASGDTATVRRLGHGFLAGAEPGATRDYLEWRVATALGDTATLRRFRDRIEDVGPLGLLWINGAIHNEGIPSADMDLAHTALLEKVRERWDPFIAAFAAHDFALTAGRPAAAERELEAAESMALPDDAPRVRDGFAAVRIMDALFAGSDTAAAAAAAEHLSARLAAGVGGADGVDGAGGADGAAGAAGAADNGLPAADIACAVAQWHAWRGVRSPAADAATRTLTAAAREPDAAVARWCSALIEAVRATVAGEPGAAALVSRVDSIARTGPPLEDFGAFAAVNLAVARLLDAVGRPDAALAAVRRRWRHGLPPERLLPPHLELEGRLAAATGDTEGAIRAYRHYLLLRPDPEPAVRPEVERVREELARLVGEGRE